MAKHAARYSVSYGMPGYMPTSHLGVYEWTTRREMVEGIKSLLDQYDIPKSRARSVGIKGLWGSIKRWGPSCYHFQVKAMENNCYLFFSGLTTQEYEEALEADNAEHGHPW